MGRRDAHARRLCGARGVRGGGRHMEAWAYEADAPIWSAATRWLIVSPCGLRELRWGCGSEGMLALRGLSCVAQLDALRWRAKAATLAWPHTDGVLLRDAPRCRHRPAGGSGGGG